jgi:zinc protease
VHPYGHTTLGFKRDVEAMPDAYEYSRAFFKRFYTPDDCTILAVGDVDHDALLAQVKTSYAGWTGHRATTAVKAEPPQTAPRARAVTWKGPTLPRLMMGYKVPATSAALPDAAALSVVAALAFGESSDLYQRLVVKEQKLIELDGDPSDVFNRDPGLFTVLAKLKPETTFDQVVSDVQAAIEKVASGGTPLEKLEATRSHLVHALTLRLKTPQAVATALGYWTAWTGDPHGLENYRRALLAVTPEDVARVAKTYLVPAHRSVVTLAGSEAPAAAAAPRAK